MENEEKPKCPKCPKCEKEMKIFIWSGANQCYYFKCNNCNLTKKEEKAETKT